jgi:small-conductance mechanosensitive channel
MQNVQDNLLKGFNNISVSATDVIPRIPVAIVAIVAGYIIIKILARILKTSFKWTKWPEGLQGIMITLLRAAMWIFLLITILQILGLTSVALALTGSFAVLLLGFSNGISSTVSDLVSGLQLANDKDFKVGYKVKAGDQKTVGIVREMDIKKTRIEDEDGSIHVVPNSVIEKNEWVVMERHVHSKMPKKSSAIMSKVSTKIKKEGNK